MNEQIACRHCGLGIRRVVWDTGGSQWFHIGTGAWYCASPLHTFAGPGDRPLGSGFPETAHSVTG